MDEHSTTALQPFSNEGVAFWKVPKQVFIFDIVDRYLDILIVPVEIGIQRTVNSSDNVRDVSLCQGRMTLQ